MTCWTVYEHIVGDAFHSKKSGSALYNDGKQVSQIWCFPRHNSTTCSGHRKCV